MALHRLGTLPLPAFDKVFGALLHWLGHFREQTQRRARSPALRLFQRGGTLPRRKLDNLFSAWRGSNCDFWEESGRAAKAALRWKSRKAGKRALRYVIDASQRRAIALHQAPVRPLACER